MRGLWLDNGTLSFKDDIPEPKPERGECLVRVTQAGICSTDIAMINGLYPFSGVLGHEFVGVVEAGESGLVGRRVVGEIYASCGRCDYCKNGLRKHCPNRNVIGITDRDGAFADRISLPEACLYSVPEGIDDRAAVFVEPLAAALDIFERVAIDRDTKVLLIGAGKLGQLVARVLVASGCRPTVVVRSESKMKRVAGLPAELATAEEIAGRLFDVVVECSGNNGGLETALAAIRPQGTLILKSTFPGLTEVDMTKVVVDEIRLVGSRCGPYDKALKLLQDGKVETASLIDAVYPVADGLAGIEKAKAPGVLKVLLDFA